MYSIMSDVTKLPNFSQRDAFVVGAKEKIKGWRTLIFKSFGIVQKAQMQLTHPRKKIQKIFGPQHHNNR